MVDLSYSNPLTSNKKGFTSDPTLLINFHYLQYITNVFNMKASRVLLQKQNIFRLKTELSNFAEEGATLRQ